MKKLIIMSLLILLLTGCYDYHELNNLNIVNSIAIDYDNNNYIIYLEIINSQKKDEYNEYTTTILKEQDPNIADAFKKVIKKSNKEVYFKQSQLLILDKKLCQEGIRNTISYLLNNNTLSSNYYLIISDDINNIINNQNHLTNAIISMLNNKNTNSYNIEKIANILLNNNKDLSLPYIEIDNNTINIEKIGIFKNDYLIDTIDKKIHNFLSNNNETDFSYDDNLITIYNKTITNEIFDNKILIKINGYGYTNQINKKYDLNDKESIYELEKQLNNEIKNQINNYFNYTINQGIDLYGLKDLYYKKFKKNIENIEYKLDINFKINKIGNLYEETYD